jgi:hypothetical protein
MEKVKGVTYHDILVNPVAKAMNFVAKNAKGPVHMYLTLQGECRAAAVGHLGHPTSRQGWLCLSSKAQARALRVRHVLRERPGPGEAEGGGAYEAPCRLWLHPASCAVGRPGLLPAAPAGSLRACCQGVARRRGCRAATRCGAMPAAGETGKSVIFAPRYWVMSFKLAKAAMTDGLPADRAGLMKVRRGNSAGTSAGAGARAGHGRVARLTAHAAIVAQQLVGFGSRVECSRQGIPARARSRPGYGQAQSSPDALNS